MLFPIGMAASQRGLPSLSLDFIYGESVDARLTTAGGAGGTRVNSAGTIVTATTPRFDYDPVTLAAKGLLVEEQRTNLLLNSLINGTNLGTQGVSVTAQQYTLSFYGTGTITMSGAFVGTLVGSGAFPSRNSVTFTPSAGTLTCTVTGTVQFAQLEVSPVSFATSFIPTAGTAVTRTVDNLTMTGANFSSWFNANAGTFVAQFDVITASQNDTILSPSDGTAANRIRLLVNPSGVYIGSVDVGSVNQANMQPAGAVSVGPTIKVAMAYALNDFAAVRDGGTVVTDSAGSLPPVDRLNIGTGASATQALNGHLRRLAYYGSRLSNTVLQALTV